MNEHKVLYIMVGAPGSGKTTWIHEHAEPGVSAHISRDRIRFNMLQPNEQYFAHEKEVYKEFYTQIIQALQSPWVTEVYADATHINEASRKKLLAHLINYLDNVDIIPVAILTDLPTCIRQNDRRVGRAHVPKEILENIYNSYEDPIRDEFQYAEVLYIDLSNI